MSLVIAAPALAERTLQLPAFFEGAGVRPDHDATRACRTKLLSLLSGLRLCLADDDCSAGVDVAIAQEAIARVKSKLNGIERTLAAEESRLACDLAFVTKGWLRDMKRRRPLSPSTDGHSALDDATNSDLKAQLSVRLSEVAQSFEARLDELDEQLKSFCAANGSLCESQTAADISSSRGGWAATEHTRFLNIRDTFCEKRYVDKPRYFQRLHMEFPSVSLESLKRHDQWCERVGLYRSQRSALVKQQREAEFALRRKFAREASTANDELRAKLSADIGKALAEHRRSQVHDRRSALREKALKKERVLRAEQFRAGQAAAAAALAERREFERKRQKDRKVADQHKRSKQAAASRQAKLDAFRARAEARRKRAEIDQKRPRVEERQQRLEESRRKLETQKALQEEEERQREARLQRLRDAVAPTSVHADLRRMQGPTAASTAPADVMPELFPRHGYSNDEVFRDKRARISESLHRAGLQQSAYARQVLSVPAAKAPSQLKSSIKFGE